MFNVQPPTIMKTSCRPAGDTGSCWCSGPEKVKLMQSDGERVVDESHRHGSSAVASSPQ